MAAMWIPVSENNQQGIPNYGELWRAGETIFGLVEKNFNCR